jgi:hypothetical protein
VSYSTRINPSLYNRLSFALDGVVNAIDAEVEFVGRHLDEVREVLAQHWDELAIRPSDPPDDRVRFVVGHFEAIPAAFAVEASMDDGMIEVRNIRVVIDPT